MGDPRGELIALDLHLDAHGVTRDYLESWQRAMTAWLGAAWTRLRLAPWPPKSFRYGFLDDLRAQPTGSLRTSDVCQIALATPAGRYLRGATLSDSGSRVREALGVLAGEVRPWLDRLTIQQDTAERDIPISLAGIVGAAVPHLRELRVRGHRAAAAPLPASVRRLVIDGESALDVIEAGSSSVVDVDLAMRSAEPHVLAGLARRLARAWFPALARIDVSRWQDQLRAMLGHSDPLRLILMLDAPERLRVLRVAPVLRVDQQDMLNLIKAHLPGLTVETA